MVAASVLQQPVPTMEVATLPTTMTNMAEVLVLQLQNLTMAVVQLLHTTTHTEAA